MLVWVREPPGRVETLLSWRRLHDFETTFLADKTSRIRFGYSSLISLFFIASSDRLSRTAGTSAGPKYRGHVEAGRRSGGS